MKIENQDKLQSIGGCLEKIKMLMFKEALTQESVSQYITYWEKISECIVLFIFEIQRHFYLFPKRLVQAILHDLNDISNWENLSLLGAFLKRRILSGKY